MVEFGNTIPQARFPLDEMSFTNTFHVHELILEVWEPVVFYAKHWN